MTMLSSAFTDLHDARFKKIYSDEYNKYDTYFDKVMKMETSDGQYEMYSEVSGHGLMQPTTENAKGESDARIQGYDLTLTNVSYSLEAEISYENIKDDRFRELDKEARILGEAAKRTPDVYAADSFKKGFGTTDRFGNSLLAADGVRFFSTLHKKSTAESSTTMSNASSTGIVLSDDNLEIGILALQEQLNEKGLLCNNTADVLIVPQKLRKTALIITGSDKRSETGDNDANVYKQFESYYGGSLRVIVWPELGAAAGGSDTAWFLQDSTKNQLIFQWREKPQVFDVEFKKNPYRYIYDAFSRFEFGMANWRGNWGSKGLGTSYSS